MKKSILILTAFIIALTLIVEATDCTITPLVINFNGVDAKGDTVAAYGDFGSMLISYDNANTWEQRRVFESGTILKYFFEDDKMTAFNNKGEINISFDKGKTWIKKANLEDSIVAVVKHPNGYFLRSKTRLHILDNDFIKINEFPFLISKWSSYFNLRKSIEYYNGNFIVVSDTSNLIIFDANLKVLDTINVINIVLCPECRLANQLFSDSVYFYFYLSSIPNRKFIYRTEDFESVEQYYTLSPLNWVNKIINNRFSILNSRDTTNQWTVFDTTKVSGTRSGSSSLKDFTFTDDKEIIVGKNKMLVTMNRKDSNINVVSEFVGYMPYTIPVKLYDSTFLFFSGYDYGSYNNAIYKSEDNGLTFKPTVEKKDPKYDKFYYSFSINAIFFDETAKKLYLGGSYMGNVGYIWISDDYGKSFAKNNLFPNLVYDFWAPSSPNLSCFPNLQKSNDNFITAQSESGYIKTFNNNFELISNFLVEGRMFDYVHSTDTNTFLVHSVDPTDDKHEIKYTTDQGLNWSLIRNYLPNEYLLYYKELNTIDKKMLAFVIYNDTSNIISFDLLDIESNKLSTIYEYEASETEYMVTGFAHAIDINENGIYLAVRDTLFYSSDIYERQKWKYYNLPKGGKINEPFKKFGDKFYASYSDSLNPYNISWLKFNDSATEVKDEITIEEKNYLYTFPPFPVPATNLIRSLIFWDMGTEITKDEISIYDINGTQLLKENNIAIDKLNLYSGYLSWDCSKIKSGIYIIQIKHGTETCALKVIVNK